MGLVKENWVKLLVLILAMSFISSNLYAKSQKILRRGTIFDYKKELNLTDKQIKKIRSILVNLNKKLNLLRAKLVIANSDLQTLLKNKADISAIDKKLREVFDYKREIIINDLIASRKIRSVLTKKQLKKWREIQAGKKE